MCNLLTKAAQPLFIPDFSPDAWPKVARKLQNEFDETVREWMRTRNSTKLFNQLDALLFDGHTESHMAGQVRGSNAGRIGLARQVGREVADSETYWLRGFVDRLEAGFYDDRARLLAAHWDLYVGKTRGTAGRGFLDGSRPNEVFDWVLGGTEDHCEECPYFASQEAMPKDFWPTTPGAGDTPCLGNCKCYLIRLSDGLTSEKPV